MTPEQRREAQLQNMSDYKSEPWSTKPASYLDALLAHFDEHEPAVADAIRFGLLPASVISAWDGERLRSWEDPECDEWTIDYPKGHPKNP